MRSPVEHAKERAAEWGVPQVYGDLHELLADPEIDAVEILTPTHLHRDHVLAAIAAGKHVSCQKPIANRVDDAFEMDAAASAAGVTLGISECFAHYPPLEKAKALIRDGAIGAPTALRIKTVVGQTDSAFQAGLWGDGYIWRLNDQSPGGHLFDDMVHKYAMAMWLVDQDIVDVQAAVRRRDLFLRAVHGHLRVRGFVVARLDGGVVHAEDVVALAILRGRRVFRGPGGRGVHLGHPMHGRDARPSTADALPR